MKLLKIAPIVLFVLTVNVCLAQTILPIPLNIQATYAKGTRTTAGSPGKNYWQNRADYNIKVHLRPRERSLAGTVDVDYFNNSPDTLNTVWFKLYANLFKKGSIRSITVPDDDITDGMQISHLTINHNTDTAKFDIDGTNMTVNVPPLLPGGHINFSITYSYKLNTMPRIRTGQVDSGAFFVAYFFPRIAVYDDIDGWNKYPYRGSEEFYNDFCHFKAEITVPGNYQVWATGNLTNPEQVYTEKYVKRIQEARLTDKVTDIITAEDLGKGGISPGNPINTWKFEADSVTDLVFATSNHYLWKASSLVVDQKTQRRTRVDAVFNPAHQDYYAVIDYARKTVDAMSYTFPRWPYPYPHETVFDGLDQMEYPMMVNDNPLETQADAISLTAHEIFHTMFPFFMGINETKYGWMDEGWATAGEWMINSIIEPGNVDNYGLRQYENSAGKEDDQPIITLTPQLSEIASLTDSYPKPALGYLYVRDMLGKELFTKALHYYITQWHGKHPMPYDFFNSMNTGSGQNLNWFWKRWFFDAGAPDLAIAGVTVRNNIYTVIIANIGGRPVPIDLTLYFSDGSTQLLHQSVMVWKTGNRTFTVTHAAQKHVKKIVLGTTYDPDIDKANNVWTAGDVKVLSKTKLISR